MSPVRGASTSISRCLAIRYVGAESSAHQDGIYFALSKVAPSDVTDGLSKTLAFTEIKLVEDTDSHDIRGRYHNPTHGGAMFTTLYPPNTTRPDRFNWCALEAAGGCAVHPNDNGHATRGA